MRKPHFLYRPRSAVLPKFFFYFDVETEESYLGKTKQNKMQYAHTFKMGCAAFVRRGIGFRWYSTQWHDMVSPFEFWRWVDEKIPTKSKAVMFAHNVGFDALITNVFVNLPLLGWQLTNYIIDGPPTLLEFQKCPNNCGMRSGKRWRETSGCKEPHRTLEIIDTLNFFRMSLKQLGDAIGTPKGEMPANADGSPDWTILNEPGGRERWFEYNKGDVQVLIDAVQQYLEFITEHNLGSFAITQASQSFTAFRHRFMKHKIFIDDNEEALRISRSAYYGGRVECFKIGAINERVTKFDINSMYPYIMQADTFPTQLAGVWKDVSLSEYQSDLQGKFKYSALCLIETDEPAYPMKKDGKLLFMTGKFLAYLTTPEIDYAFEQGHLKELREVAIYHHDEIFKEFIHYFYNLRLEARKKGDEQQAFFLKILMNSLYGKFGQNGRKWKTLDEVADESEIKIWMEIDADTGAVEQFRQIGRVVQFLEGEEESLNSHPAIAAHITGAARIYLWKLIKIAGGISNVFYIDTDSLFVNDSGREKLNRFLNETELGMLKNEGESTEVVINGLKDYKFGNYYKLKGVREAWNPIEPNVYKLEIFRGFKGALREAGLDTGQVIITRGTKTLTRNYNKGIVQKSGHVTPFQAELAEV